MAFPVIQQSLHHPVDTPATSTTTPSWTPGANELCLCFISMRSTSAPGTNVSGVTGNGLTWVKLTSAEKDDTQNVINHTVYHALGASPSAGGVTVNFGLDPVAASIQLIRISGVDTTGTNGSGAIGNVSSADTGATDTTPASITVVTTRNDSKIIGFGTGRGQTWTKGASFTNILVNQTANSSGNIIRSNTEHQDIATSGTNVTVDFSLSAAGDWVLSGIEIKSPGGTIFNRTLSGSITPSGALTKSAQKRLSGSITSTGALIGRTVKVLSGTVTSAGNLVKIPRKRLSGSITPSGILITARVFFRTLAGTVGLSGTLFRRTNKSLSGSITPIGTLRSIARKVLSGIVGSSGTLTTARVFLKSLSGVVGSSGSLRKVPIKRISGAVTPVGTLLKLTRKVLSGVVAISGSLLIGRVKAKIRQLFRGPIYSENRLSFSLRAAPWNPDNYYREVTQEVTSYDQTLSAIGGFWSSNITIKLPFTELEDWLENGIGRELIVRGRGSSTAFEGIVNRISMEIGGYSISVGPYTDIANKVKIVYSQLLQLGDGEVTGIRAETGYLEDAISQAKYGILVKNFSTGGLDSSVVTDLQNMLLERYKSPGRSEDLNLPGTFDKNYIDVKLECVGYAHLFQKYLYNNTASTGLEFLSTKLKKIIQEEPNGLFSTLILDENQTLVKAYENDDNEAWGLIKGLIALGDSNLFRYTFSCYEGRKITYKIFLDDILYYRPLREGAGVIQDKNGSLLEPWEIRPGVNILVTDLMPGRPLELEPTSDHRVIYAETVQFRMPNSLVINGSHYFKIEQKLAQLGIKGIS